MQNTPGLEPFYLILSSYQGRVVTCEQEIGHTNREQAVAMIASGEVCLEIEGVLFIDMMSGTVRDASEEIAAAVAQASWTERRQLCPIAQEFIDQYGKTGWINTPQPRRYISAESLYH